MHRYFFSVKDTFINSGSSTIDGTDFKDKNVGKDEILEINKVVSNNGTVANVSRILIDFDLSFISQSIIDSKIPTTAKYYLNLYDATSEEVEAEQNIFVYMVEI